MTPDQMAGALFSKDRSRRLVLWRHWDDTLKTAMCIGLNPSTANENKNDRTISFLIKMLREKGYGGLRMVNLFTQVTPTPYELDLSDNRIDISAIKTQALLSQEIILCWGSFREARDRGREVAVLFPDALCLGRNADRSPKHPAWYVRNGYDVRLVPLIKYL